MKKKNQSSAQGDINASQFAIYNYMKKKALSYEGEMSRELKAYLHDQKKYAKRKFKTCDELELFVAMASSKVVYLGDFHTFDQSARNLQRIIKTLIEEKANLILGVELVHQEHQSYVDMYLDKLISEQELLESINYNESWRFPWSHYREFFDLARIHGHRILALNSQGTLSQRDQSAAEIIAGQISQHPNHLFLILFGELHIMPNKLPKKVSRAFGHKLPQTVIHQNLDDVFWELTSKHIVGESVIVKFGNNEFSIQSSPPWIKYESMIYWYDNLCEDPEFDLHDSIMQEGLKSFTSNIHDNFVYLCEHLASTLGVQCDRYILEDFNLYDHNQISALFGKINQNTPQKLRAYFRKLIIEGHLFHLTASNIYYCSSYSINRISLLAGIHLLRIMAKTDDIEEKILTSSDNHAKFMFLLKRHLFAYLCSKIINPYRKCDLYLDIKNNTKHKNIDLKKSNQIALLFFDHIRKIRVFSKMALNRKSLRTVYLSARIAGKAIGDAIYEKLTKEKWPSSPVLDLLTDPSNSDETLAELLAWLYPDSSFKSKQKRLF